MTEPLLAAPVLAVTVKDTDPLPVRLVGELFTQDRLFDVVQGQLELDAVTETEPVPPFDVKLPLVGDIV